MYIYFGLSGKATKSQKTKNYYIIVYIYKNLILSEAGFLGYIFVAEITHLS